MDGIRWKEFSLALQLGHVGSEFSRALYWETKADFPNREKALLRALQLLDLTIQDDRWRPRLKELTRLREVMCDWFCGQKQYDTSPQQLEKYFTDFAVYSRKEAAV